MSSAFVFSHKRTPGLTWLFSDQALGEQGILGPGILEIYSQEIVTQGVCTWHLEPYIRL